MDNQLWLMIKSLYEFAIVVQDFVHTFAGVSFPLFLADFGVNVRESF